MARRKYWLMLALGPALFGCRAAHAEGSPQPDADAPTPTPAASSATTVAAAREAPPPPPSPKGPCPAEMARVGKTCVDRWEGILVETGADGSEKVHPHEQRPEQDVRYEARSRPDVYPQAYINRLEAQAACENAGKRICKLSEWYDACRGSKKTTFPYGWNKQRGKCNVERPHLLGQLFGRDPRKWSYINHFNSPKLDLMPGGLAKTGELSECVSDYGTFDMVGNLHEWVSDIVDDKLPRKLPLNDDMRGRIDVNWGHGIFMGGFFSTSNEHGDGCNFMTPGHEPKYHDYSTGFRCCKDAAHD